MILRGRIGPLPALSLVVVLLVLGCGSSSPPNKAITCYDGLDQPTQDCALDLQETTCPSGDANACAVTKLIEVHADDGTNGVCVRVLIDNQCSDEIYSDTCISVDAATVPGGWQCWRSSTAPGGAIDVNQCHATGKVFHYSSKSSGAIDTIAAKCMKP